MLDDAHNLGRARRRRVQRPLHAATFALLGCALACVVVPRIEPFGDLDVPLLYVQSLTTMVALPCLLALLQPGEPRFVRRALGAYALGSACVGTLFASRFVALCAADGLVLQHARCLAAPSDGRPCWARLELAAFVLAVAAVGIGGALAAARALVSVPTVHARIRQLWRIAGLSAATLALAGLATILAQAAAGAYDRAPLALGLSLLLVAICGLDALLALRGRLRARVRAFIEARGEAVERAAVLSALLGRRSVEEARALARASFRSVRLDLLSAADLASNDAASSARLHALSTPAHLGDVDVRARARAAREARATAHAPHARARAC
jgi:hypothetical protein